MFACLYGSISIVLLICIPNNINTNAAVFRNCRILLINDKRKSHKIGIFITKNEKTATFCKKYLENY